MQTLTRVYKVIIDDYYHMTTMDDVGWIKLTLCSLFFLQTIGGPLLYIYLYFIILNSLLKCVN
jgi:hypothetical protein